MARINRLLHQLEFDKEEYILFIDDYMLLYRSINMCRNANSLKQLIENQFLRFRERYKKTISSKSFCDKMGRLYAHAYNTIQKLTK